MSLDALIMLVGAVVAIVPFLGFPASWWWWMYVLLGVIVVGLGIAVRRRGLRRVEPPKPSEFVESAPPVDQAR